MPAREAHRLARRRAVAEAAAAVGRCTVMYQGQVWTGWDERVALDAALAMPKPWCQGFQRLQRKRRSRRERKAIQVRRLRRRVAFDALLASVTKRLAELEGARP